MRTFTVTGGSSIYHQLKSQLYMTKSMREISAPQWGATSRLLGASSPSGQCTSFQNNVEEIHHVGQAGRF